MIDGIRTTLILLLFVVILLCMFNSYKYEGFVGEANDWGGAPVTENPKDAEQCEQRVKEFQTKWDKEASSRDENAAIAAKKKELQDADKVSGYTDQLKMMNDNIKDAQKKQSIALQKMDESIRAEQQCQGKLVQELQKLEEPKACCDQMSKLKDEAVKVKKAAQEKAKELEGQNGELRSKRNNLESQFKSLVSGINQCNKERGDAQKENEQLKRDVAIKQNRI